MNSTYLNHFVELALPAIGITIVFSYLLTVAKIASPLRARLEAYAESDKRLWVFLSEMLKCGSCTGTWIYLLVWPIIVIVNWSTKLKGLNTTEMTVIFLVFLSGLGYYYVLWSFVKPSKQ